MIGSSVDVRDVSLLIYLPFVENVFEYTFHFHSDSPIPILKSNKKMREDSDGDRSSTSPSSHLISGEFFYFIRNVRVRAIGD